MYKKWFSYVKNRNLILPTLFILFLSGNNFMVSVMLQIMIDGGVNGKWGYIVWAAAGMILASALYGVVYYWSGKANAKLNANIVSNVKQDYLRKHLNRPLLEIEYRKDSDIYVQLEKDIEEFSSLYTDGILPLLGLIFSLTIGSIYTLLYSWEILIFCLLTLPFILMINNYLSKKTMKYQHKISEIEADEVRLTTDVFHSKTILNIFTSSGLLSRMLRGIKLQRYENVSQKEKYTTLNYLMNDTGILAIECTIFFIGIPLIIKGSLQVGAFIGIWNAAIGSFIWPIVDFPEIMGNLKDKKVSFQRLLDTLLLPLIKSEGKIHVEIGDTNELKMSDVNFAYPSQDDKSVNVLSQVNIVLKSRGITLIKGESGAGKSTFLKILLGLYEPNSGDIYFNDVKVGSDELASLIGYVPQSQSLLPMTVRENLTFQQNVEDEELQKLCKAVGIDEWILSLPQRYDTYMYKDTMLSVGQATRIAVVRALLHKKPYILLDEPFAGLDEVTIDQVSKVLKGISDEIGVIIVSHRTSTSDIANQTVVIEEGKVYV